MQVKIRFSFVLFVATSLAGLKAIAQDDGQQPMQPVQEMQELNQQHPELNLNDDKTLLMDADARASKNQSQSNMHDAGSSGNSSKNKSDGSSKSSPNDKTEEDPLSFNFIYFIIQKFKASDIVDD